MEAEKMSMFAELKKICPDQSMWTNPKISMASSYEVISMELTIQKQNIDEDQKVFIARLILGAACRGVEWGSGFIYKKVNGKFLQLEGWANSIMADTAQFDPILRRCYRKLFPQGMGKSDPFVDLAIALAISAVTYGLLNRVMGPAQGAATTSVPSNANSFMDRNTPTPAQNRAQAQRNPKPPQGGGGGFMDNIMGALGGGEGNPLGAIFGMMKNGGLQNFMQGVQNHGKQEPPGDPFEATSAPIDDTMDPLNELRRDAQQDVQRQQSRQSRRRAPPPPPYGRDPYMQPVNSVNTRKRRNRPLTPPFDERAGRYDSKRSRRQAPRRIPSPVFGEPAPGHVEMEPPDEDDIQDRASVYDTSSNMTMDCESSSEGDVGQID